MKPMNKNDFEAPRFVPRDGHLCMGGPCSEVNESVEEADTYINAGSLEAARVAVGGVLQLVDEVLLVGW